MLYFKYKFEPAYSYVPDKEWLVVSKVYFGVIKRFHCSINSRKDLDLISVISDAKSFRRAAKQLGLTIDQLFDEASAKYGFRIAQLLQYNRAPKARAIMEDPFRHEVVEAVYASDRVNCCPIEHMMTDEEFGRYGHFKTVKGRRLMGWKPDITPAQEIVLLKVEDAYKNGQHFLETVDKELGFYVN